MCEKCKSVRTVLKQTVREIKKLENNPNSKAVDADMVKTAKAMAYEDILEIYVRE